MQRKKSQNFENVLSVKDLSIIFDDKPIFKNLSFDIKSGEKVFLNGANGSGKSSIIKLILGEDIKYKGEIFKSARLKISYVPQVIESFDGSLMEFAASKKIDKTRFFTLLSKMGFDSDLFDMNFSSLSLGSQKKVAIAKSLCETADLYIFDEPLNFVDVISRVQIENVIKNSNATFLIVEHDTAFIKSLANKIVEIKNA